MRRGLLHCAGLVAFAALWVGGAEPFDTPIARLTVRVRDEEGTPVSGAKVTFTFRNARTGNGVPVTGLTNATGEFAGEGSSDPKVGGRIQKDGYYSSGFPFVPFRDAQDGHWLPWNPTFETTLRPIGNPVALYAKRVQVEIPDLDRPCAYDLERADWVAPYGKGRISDFVFTARRHSHDNANYAVSVTLTFSNPFDGITKTALPAVGRYSFFKWPREAPDRGFDGSVGMEMQVSSTSVTQNFEDSDAFFFRVRSVNSGGKLAAANYGKIRGGFRLDAINAKKTCIVIFTYYLNPESLNRNLEWNPKKDLLAELKDEERPRDP